MPDYPGAYPLPDEGSYSGAIRLGVSRTEVPAARPDQRLRYNAPRVEVSMTFTMTNDDYDTWRTWVEANAYNWFNMPVVSPHEPDDITSTRPVRFISDINYQKQGDDWLSVTVAAEIQQGVRG